MIKSVLSHIEGIEVYGLISILLFFVFFVGMLLWVFRLNGDHLDAMGRTPLDETSAGMRPESRPTDLRAHE
jgi:hypothetical protein